MNYELTIDFMGKPIS